MGPKQNKTKGAAAAVSSDEEDESVKDMLRNISLQLTSMNKKVDSTETEVKGLRVLFEDRTLTVRSEIIDFGFGSGSCSESGSSPFSHQT